MDASCCSVAVWVLIGASRGADCLRSPLLPTCWRLHPLWVAVLQGLTSRSAPVHILFDLQHTLLCCRSDRAPLVPPGTAYGSRPSAGRPAGQLTLRTLT